MERLGFRRILAGRQLPDGGLQIAQHLGHAGVVVAMERRQLVEDVVPALHARVVKDLTAGDHLEGDAAEAQRDLDACVPRVLALGRPLRGQMLEVVVARDEVVGDAEDGGAQGAVAVAHQRSVGFVYLVALITGWSQPGAAGDALGVGVVLDRPRLAGEVGGADDVDAGEGEQQRVGRLYQPAGDFAFQSLDFQGFSLAVAVQGERDAVMLRGGDVAGRGLFGPVEDGLDGASLEADAGVAE